MALKIESLFLKSIKLLNNKKFKSRMKITKFISAVLLGLLVNQPIGFAAPVINPDDPNSGLVDNASVVNTIFINQQTQNLSLYWNSFNISPNETVQFIQPSSTSIAFNHINSLDPSIIAGQLNANGQIVLVNPNGLIFSEGATINVGGIVASGLSINSEQFLNGSVFLNHEQNTNGHVINNGVINASTGGSVTLVGTEVVNNGVITASLGKVNLAAGESGVLTFDSQGMFGIEVTSNTVQTILGNDAAVTNNGEIITEGGQVLLTAEVSRAVFTNAVNNQGLVSANSIELHDGVIRITSSTGNVQQDGELNVSSKALNVNGGTIEVYATNINNILIGSDST
jgi:filamentous hemagglutinin family protein